MPAYIPGITNRAIRGLQIRTRGITNKGGMKGFQIRTKRLQIGAKKIQTGREITNLGTNDYKQGQGLQISAEHHALCRRISQLYQFDTSCLYYTK